MAQVGYTLPVFSVAAAKAAFLYLLQPSPILSVTLDLLPDSAEIPIQHIATVAPNTALAIALSNPGDNLDLTRNTPIWAWVQLNDRQTQPLILEAGEGLGKTTSGDPAIYSYARRLFETNLLPLIPGDRTATVRIILPEGRQLAQRTSNAAFGIVDGLALLGTSGISQPFSAADHLETLRHELQQKVAHQPHLVFCIGANGFQVAEQWSIPDRAIVQTGNWLGALLVEAGVRGTKSVLLLGYQGKLIKLAGGIFNTSSHLADAKLEILAATVIRTGGTLADAQAVLNCQTADAAYFILQERGLVPSVFGALAEAIAQKSQAYVQKYADVVLEVGVMLFDRKGQIISQNTHTTKILTKIISAYSGRNE